MVKLNHGQFNEPQTKWIDMNAWEKLVGSSWKGQEEMGDGRSGHYNVFRCETEGQILIKLSKKETEKNIKNNVNFFG